MDTESRVKGAKLSEDEIGEILAFNRAGFSNRAIAAQIGIHHKTVGDKLTALGVPPNKAPRKSARFVTKDTIECSKCGEVKSASEFHVQRSNAKYPYRLSYCDACRAEQTRQATRRTPYTFLRDRYFRLRARCLKSGIPFDLAEDELDRLYNEQDGKCFYTDIPMTYEARGKPERHSLSIDKIEPHHGYVMGNVVLCINKANTVKSDLTLAEICDWLPGWYSRIMSRARIAANTNSQTQVDANRALHGATWSLA